jgi:hypothetical protein
MQDWGKKVETWEWAIEIDTDGYIFGGRVDICEEDLREGCCFC